MRKILNISLFLLLIMTFSAATAQDDHNGVQTEQVNISLTIASDQQAFWLYVDDVQQNKEPVKSIKVEGVPAGEHKVRVEINNEKHNVVGQNIQLQSSDNTYKVDQKQNMYGISLGKKVQQTEVVVPLAMADPRKGSREHKHYESHEERRYHPEHAPKPYRPERRDRPNFTNNAERPDKQHRPQNVGSIDPMDTAAFHVTLERITSEKNDADKLTVAKELIANNMLNINQIEQICRTFEFDDKKLDFAKIAYYNCTEKVSYSQLQKIFQQESSVQEFLKFLEKIQQ